MYRRRNSNEIEDAIMSDSGTALPDRAVTNNGISKKKGFRKSTSAEPTAGHTGHGRKKSFTHFFNNLFSPKSSTAENRQSGISIESSSFESVNTILSTNSFTFVSPKKGKMKGKRIPMQPDETPKCSRRKKKLGTLTRIGMKMGLKSKYNLQSCESLHHLHNNSDAAANQRDVGTLGSTYRKKRKAPAPPMESSSSSPVVQSKQQQLTQQSEARQGAAQESIAKPSTSKQALKEQQQASSLQKSISKSSEPANVTQQSVTKSPTSQQTAQQVPAENVPIIIPQTIPSPKPSTSQQKSPKVTKNFDPTTFKITSRHRRSSSDGTSKPQEPRAASSIHSQSATLSHTYRNKCHVRGKRKAPAPPNPFGDPDAPEEEDEQEVAPLPQPTPVPITPTNPFLDEEPGDDSTPQINTEVPPLPPPTEQQQPVAIQITNENEDEIFQNNLNEQLFQEQELHQQQQQQQTEPAPGPSRLSQAPSEQQLAAAQRDLQVLMTVLNNDNNTPVQQQPQIKVDERTKQELVELKRESDKSPLMFLRAKSKSGSESNRSSAAEIRNSLNITTPPASPEPEYKKLTPRPWYKRATSSSGGQKKTKPLLQPLPGMTKFSDIDREANRIIEEQRRRTAEQGFHDSARELITMFNSFNESQRAPSPTPNISSVTTTTNSSDSSVAASNSVSAVVASTVSSSSAGAVTPGSSSVTSPVSSAPTAAMTVSQLLAASRPNPRAALSSINLPKTSLTTKSSIGSVAAASQIGLTTAAASITPTSSRSTSNGTANSQGQQSEEPKKLAIVRPQSSPQSKTTSATTTTTTTTSTTTSINTPTFCKYPVQRKEDWICSRCTLKNAAWRLTCEACFNRTDSSISKLSSVFESPLTGTFVAPTTASSSSQSTSVTSSLAVTTSAAGSTSTVTATASSAPPCDNFLGQRKAPEVARKEDRQEGVKLDGESGEELDIVQLRQQRLAFFQKKPPSSSEASQEDLRVEFQNEPVTNSVRNEVAITSVVSSEAAQSEGNHHQAPVNNTQSHNSNKPSQVFSDDEDDTIDALIGLQRTSTKIGNPEDETANAPTFGPRNWNPFQPHRFRPMLESIVEQSQDVYAQLDAPYYENWEFGQGPPQAIDNENDINGRNIPWTNTFMRPEYSPTDPMFGYYYANSDSSSCSECEREQQQKAAEAVMDGNRTPSRRHSSHQQHHHHHMRHYSAYFPNDLPPEQKLTLEDYRRLGAVPKYLLHHHHDGGDRYSHHSGERSHRRHSSALDEHRPSPLRGSNGAEGRSDGNSVEVAKLLRRLETAIAEGDHRLAATLAHDLALLKVNCAVAKEDDMTKPITIRVYVEDRFMQQGPFQVQVTKLMTVRDVKLKIESDWSIPAAFQKWILGRKMAENDDQKLLDFEISHDDMAFLYLVTPQIAPTNTQPVQPSLSTPPQSAGLRETSAQKNVQPSQPPLPVKTVKQEPAATQVKSVKQDTASQIKSVNTRAEPPPTLPPKNSSLFSQEAYVNVLAPAPVKTSAAKTQQKVITTESLSKKVSAGVQATTPAVPPATKSVKNSEEFKRVKDAETKPIQSTGVSPIIPTKSADPKQVSTGQLSAKVSQSTVNTTPTLASKSSSASSPPPPKAPTELKKETTEPSTAKPAAVKVTSSPSVAHPTPKELSAKVETSNPPGLPLKKTDPVKSTSFSRATEPAKPPAPQGSLTTEPPKQSPTLQPENSSKVTQQSSPMQDKKTKPSSNIAASVSPQVANPSSATAAVASTSPSSQSQHASTKNTKPELAQPVTPSQTKLIKRSPYTLATSTKVTAATSTTTLAADSAANNARLFHKASNKTATKMVLPPTAENSITSLTKSNELAAMDPPKLTTDSLKVDTDPSKVAVQSPSISNKSGAPVQPSPEKALSSAEPVPMKRTKKKQFDSGSSSSVTPEPPSSDVENNAKSNPDLSATNSVATENKPVEQISLKSTEPQSASLSEKKQTKEEIKVLSPSPKPERVEAGVQSTLPLPTKAVKKLQQSAPLPASAASANVSTTNVDVPGKANEAVIVHDAPANELKTEKTKENNAESYNEMLKLLEHSDLILNHEEFDCPVCFCPVPAKDGIVLRECLHSFCKECLIGSVQYADEPQVKCPYRDDKYSCNSLILEREIKALVPPEIFERHLAKSVKIAEGKIANTFHCRTADCAGWCVFEDDVNVFVCPVCRKRNCLTCQAIHEGVDCQQYQRQLAIDSETDENAKSSRLMLEKMIQRGEALECPACHVVLLKKWGCDWVRCSYCKTEICWITKGFRWGPNGKGDTSGGCKCGVNGVRCHPKCTYCH